MNALNPTTAPSATTAHPELPRLDGLTIGELQHRYAEVFGEPSRCRHRQHLVKRILWRVQALAEGDISERARRQAQALARDADLRLGPPRSRRGGDDAAGGDVGARLAPVVTLALDPPGRERLPRAGTVLRRMYKGEPVEVKVLSVTPQRFEYRGEEFKSLTAVTKRVTGSHWNGMQFFGLSAPKVKEAATP
ncbi:MAG TPA: DUF2924 domain-containing protein [Phycisphaerales bacterium]|nr:DUF2924 domain-containing protein [Phycisphaerales bacterium]